MIIKYMQLYSFLTPFSTLPLKYNHIKCIRMVMIMSLQGVCDPTHWNKQWDNVDHVKWQNETSISQWCVCVCVGRVFEPLESFCCSCACFNPKSIRNMICPRGYGLKIMTANWCVSISITPFLLSFYQSQVQTRKQSTFNLSTSAHAPARLPVLRRASRPAFHSRSPWAEGGMSDIRALQSVPHAGGFHKWITVNSGGSSNGLNWYMPHTHTQTLTHTPHTHPHTHLVQHLHLCGPKLEQHIKGLLHGSGLGLGGAHAGREADEPHAVAVADQAPRPQRRVAIVTLRHLHRQLDLLHRGRECHHVLPTHHTNRHRPTHIHTHAEKECTCHRLTFSGLMSGGCCQRSLVPKHHSSRGPKILSFHNYCAKLPANNSNTPVVS